MFKAAIFAVAITVTLTPHTASAAGTSWQNMVTYDGAGCQSTVTYVQAMYSSVYGCEMAGATHRCRDAGAGWEGLPAVGNAKFYGCYTPVSSEFTNSKESMSLMNLKDSTDPMDSMDAIESMISMGPKEAAALAVESTATAGAWVPPPALGRLAHATDKYIVVRRLEGDGKPIASLIRGSAHSYADSLALVAPSARRIDIQAFLADGRVHGVENGFYFFANCSESLGLVTYCRERECKNIIDVNSYPLGTEVNIHSVSDTQCIDASSITAPTSAIWHGIPKHGKI